MDKPGCSKDQDGPVDSDIEFASSDSSWTDEVEGQDLDSRKQLMEEFFEYLQKFHRPKRKRSNSKNTQKNEGEELENKKKSHKKKKSHEKKKPHNEKKSKKKEDGEEDGSILQKEVDLTDTNHGAQMLNALGDVRENNASTAPVPRNEAGTSTTRNFPSTAIDDSSTTGHGQLAPEGNNVVPVKTGEKTSVGEVRIDNSTQREQLLLQADVRSVGFDSNQGGSLVRKILEWFPDANHQVQMMDALHGVVRENTASTKASTTSVPQNEAGPSATGSVPSTANNDSSTTSNDQMAPEGNNVVPVMTGEKTSVGEGGSLVRKILELFPDTNHQVQMMDALCGVVRENTASTAPVPHKEAGPSATANFPSTATNDSSTTSHGRMAPGEKDARDLAAAASQALAGRLPWFPAIDPSQVQVQETTMGKLGLVKCPICQINIESKPTNVKKDWSTSEVTKHIPVCIIKKLMGLP